MFWRIPAMSAASPVDAILDKDNYTLEELLDEDEIIQECKAMNNRLINFLQERSQVEQLLRFIVEVAPEEAEKKQSFKFPFIACEIFTCEVDYILQTLIEDEELMNILFSFLKPDHQQSTLSAGYFSKVVLCLMSRRAAQLMNYIQDHPEIIHQLIDLIGITSIMEVLIRLIGADENMYSSYTDALQWVASIDVLDLIVDKFNSSDSPEVHANTAEVLCAITRYAPPGLAAKICSPSFVGRLFRHALEDSRPKSVLVHSLSVCISLLDPKRLLQSSYQSFRSQLSHGAVVIANPETVDGMLESLGALLKLLNVTTSEAILPTTYGCLKPPLGKHRLKIVEFVSILFTLGSEDAEKELIRLGALRHVLDLFFEYPYNNFLHHQVDNIIGSCMESKKTSLIEHLLDECDIVGRILGAERHPTLPTDCNKPTVSAQGRSPPRIGIIGHLTHIANKLVQGASSSGIIQKHLQENSEWVAWHANVLVKRNALENVYNWACGRPTSLHDRARDSDDEDFRDRDYDVAVLASNLSQAFQYNIYGNDDIEEAQGTHERDSEDVYFDDESAEVVISSLRLGDDQDSSLFTNSNWFAFEDDRAVNESSAGSLASPSPNSDDTDEVVVGESAELAEKLSSLQLSSNSDSVDALRIRVNEGEKPVNDSKEDSGNLSTSSGGEKPPEWIEWRETTDSNDLHGANTTASAANGEIEAEGDHTKDDIVLASRKCLTTGGNAETEEAERSSSLRKMAVIDSSESDDMNQSGSPTSIPNSIPEDSGHEKPNEKEEK